MKEETNKELARWKAAEIQRILDYSEANELLGKKRGHSKVYPRAYLYQYMREVLKCSTQQIADLFNKDHATVCHGTNNIYEAFKHDTVFNEYIADVGSLFPLNNQVTYNKLRDSDYDRIKVVTTIPIALTDRAKERLNIILMAIESTSMSEGINYVLENLEL